MQSALRRARLWRSSVKKAFCHSSGCGREFGLIIVALSLRRKCNSWCTIDGQPGHRAIIAFQRLLVPIETHHVVLALLQLQPQLLLQDANGCIETKEPAQ